MLKKESLLVIGGTGFIGSHVVKEALKQDFKVTIIFRNNFLPSKKIKKVDYIKVDITNENNLRSKLNNLHFDYVINLSGYIDHGNYFDSGMKVMDTHFKGVKNLINIFQNKNIKSG